MPKQLFDLSTEREVCDFYWTRLPSGYYPSYAEVGEHFGCSPAHVRNLLKKHHRNRRTQSETRERRPCKPINQPTGPAPLCACGCGTPVAWISKENRWPKYAKGHYRPKMLCHDPEWLRVEYVQKMRTVNEIAAQFGVRTTTVTKAIRSAGYDPRTLSESLIQRGSVSRERNPAWKGGVAEWEYAPDWKRICRGIKDRDKWICQGCGERRTRWGVHLHVHHIDGDKLNNDPANLTSLCAKCHRKAHGAR